MGCLDAGTSVLIGQPVAIETVSVLMKELIATRGTSSQEGWTLWTDDIYVFMRICVVEF